MEEAITQLKAKGRLKPWKDPGPGRRRLEITCREKGVVVWHKAGPSNIVLGLYTKYLESKQRVCAQCGKPGLLLPQGICRNCLDFISQTSGCWP